MLTPYYEDDSATIYHGDCREILPHLSADVVLTDPPYAVDLPYDEYHDTPEGLAAIVSDVFPLLVAAAPVVALTPGVANIHAWPRPRWTLCWRSTNAANSTGYWGFNEWQPVMVYGTDPYLSNGMGRRPDVVSVASSFDADWHALKANGHPCPKPLGAWKAILLRVCPLEGSTVLDPFMGSGTTLRAAKDLSRQAIGIEMSERYCEVAANRLAQEVLF
jgi:site-specific DNA-methyltransferase (adenine-specific)